MCILNMFIHLRQAEIPSYFSLFSLITAVIEAVEVSGPAHGGPRMSLVPGMKTSLCLRDILE